MFTAIVLSRESQDACFEKAAALGALKNAKIQCHHVTLALGDASDLFNVGETYALTVTHYGHTKGRVCAFRVEGAPKGRNLFPHVTIATFGDAKPKESNLISVWIPIVPFKISGVIEICD
jgi:hypothetical protein